jgi:hypothetical protein
LQERARERGGLHFHFFISSRRNPYGIVFLYPHDHHRYYIPCHPMYLFHHLIVRRACVPTSTQSLDPRECASLFSSRSCSLGHPRHSTGRHTTCTPRQILLHRRPWPWTTTRYPPIISICIIRHTHPYCALRPSRPLRLPRRAGRLTIFL